MNKFKRLPDAEFEIMKVVWANTPPVTTNILMEQLGKERDWKTPTLISFLIRLIDKGFLRSEKNGKERTYFPMVNKEDYLESETGNFIKQYHGNSFVHLVNTLYDSKNLDDNDLDELLKWAKERRN